MSPTREAALLAGSSKILKPSPNEESSILKEALAERRKHRLLQVRMQEKRLAEQIRNAVKKKKDEALQAFDKHLKESWEEKVTAELQQLEKEYKERLESIGQGHKSSLEVPEKNELVSKQQAAERALQRYKDAFQKITEQRTAVLKAREEKCLLRESIAKKEQARASLMASKPLPIPDFVLTTHTKNRSSSTRSKSVDSFSTTRYHMAVAFAEREDSSPDVNATEAARNLEEKLMQAKNMLHKDLNERKEKSRLRHEHARQQVLLDQSKDRLMHQLEELEFKDRVRRQQALQKIPAQVFQPPHQRLEDANAKQLALEEMFENAHHVNRVTHHTALQLDLNSEEPSIDQSGFAESSNVETQLDEPIDGEDIAKAEIEKGFDDVFIASDPNTENPEQQKPGTSARMQKLLGRIRKQQNEWAKRSVRIKLNSSESQNTDDDLQGGREKHDNYKQTETSRSEVIDNETTDSLVSADIESARCTNTNSDSVNGDDIPDHLKAIAQERVEAPKESDKSDENSVSPSEEESLLHPFEKAKIIRSASKQRTKNTSPDSIDVDDDNVILSLENRKQTIENHKHLLEIQKQRLANQILRRELKDTGTELGLVIEKDSEKLPKSSSISSTVDYSGVRHLDVVELPIEKQLSSQADSLRIDANIQSAFDGGEDATESKSIPMDKQLLYIATSGSLKEGDLPRDFSEDIADRFLPEALHSESKSKATPQTFSDVSFLSEIDSSRRADLARKYPNILEGVIENAADSTVTSERTLTRYTPLIAGPKIEPKTTQPSSRERTEGAAIQLERIRSYQRQLLEKQRWLKSRQDVIQGRQSVILEQASKDHVRSSIVKPKTQGEASELNDGLSLDLEKGKSSTKSPKDARNDGSVYFEKDTSLFNIGDPAEKPLESRESPKMHGKFDELLTRDLATMLSETQTVNQRREIYEGLFSDGFLERSENLKNVGNDRNQTMRTMPRLGLPSLSDADTTSPTNSGIEAHTESIDNKFPEKTFQADLNINKAENTAVSSDQSQQGNLKVTDHLGTHNMPRKQSRISEKPAFSPIQEVEERSFRKSILSPGPNEVFKGSGTESTSSLAEQELPSARSSENFISPPRSKTGLNQSQIQKPDSSVFSFQDLQSILSESDFLPLPSVWKKEPESSTRNSCDLPTKFPAQKTIVTDQKGMNVSTDLNTSKDWIRLQPEHGSMLNNNKIQIEKSPENAKTNLGTQPSGSYVPFTIMSSQTVDWDPKTETTKAYENLVSGLKQTNSLDLILDNEPGDLPDKSAVESVSSMRETRPIHLEDSGSSNASKTSLTNLSKYEEILEKVRMLPYRHLEEHNKLVESYQTWRKETVEPLIDPAMLYQDDLRTYDRAGIVGPGAVSRLPEIYVPVGGEKVFDGSGETEENRTIMDGRMDLHQPVVVATSVAMRTASRSPDAVEFSATENAFASEASAARRKQYGSPFSTREPIIHVYEPSLSAHSERLEFETDSDYNEVPGAYIMDHLMEQRLMQGSTGQTNNQLVTSMDQIDVKLGMGKSGRAGPVENPSGLVESRIIENAEFTDASNVIQDQGINWNRDPVMFRNGIDGSRQYSTSSKVVTNAGIENSIRASPEVVERARHVLIQDDIDLNESDNAAEYVKKGNVDISKGSLSNPESLQKQHFKDYSSKLLGSSFARSTIGNSAMQSTREHQSTDIRSDETISELARLGPIGSSISFPIALSSDNTETITESSEPTIPRSGLRNPLGSSEASHVLSSSSSTGFENIRHAIKNIFANIPNFSTDADETSSESTRYFEPRKPKQQSSEESSAGTNIHIQPLVKTKNYSDTESTSTRFDSEGGFSVPPFPRFASTRLAAEAESASPPSMNSSVISDLNLSLLSNLYFQDDKGRSETSWLFPYEHGPKDSEFERAQSSTPNGFSETTDNGKDFPDRVTDGYSAGSDDNECITDHSSSTLSNSESSTEYAPILSWSEVLSSQQDANEDHKNQSVVKKEALMRKSQQRVQRISERKQDGETGDHRKSKYSADGRFKKTDCKKTSKENLKPKDVKRQAVDRSNSKDAQFKAKTAKEIKLSVKRGSKELAKQQVLQENRMRVKQFEKKIQNSLRSRRK